MLISPVDSPDSQSVIGRIFTHEKRPVPECWISFLFFSGNTDEPVNTN